MFLQQLPTIPKVPCIIDILSDFSGFSVSSIQVSNIFALMSGGGFFDTDIGTKAVISANLARSDSFFTLLTSRISIHSVFSDLMLESIIISSIHENKVVGILTINDPILYYDESSISSTLEETEIVVSYKEENENAEIE